MNKNDIITNHNNGPEIDELGREKVGVAVAQHGKVVALNVAEREDQVFPAMLVKHLTPTFEAIVIDCNRSPNQGERDVAEKCLKGRNIGTVNREQL